MSSTNRIFAQTGLPDDVRATCDWLLDVVEAEQRHWPDGGPTHGALQRVRERILAPHTSLANDLRGRLNRGAA